MIKDWLMLGAAIALIALALFLAQMKAFSPPAPEDTPFLKKANAFAREYNLLVQDLQRDVANRQRFIHCEEAWERLHSDPGWLR